MLPACLTFPDANKIREMILGVRWLTRVTKVSASPLGWAMSPTNKIRQVYGRDRDILIDFSLRTRKHVSLSV